VRIVLDINVIVSGIISKEAAPGGLLALWRDRQFVLVVSHAQISRMQEVLRRPRLQRFFNVEEAESIIADILNAAVIVEHDPSVILSIDPEDNIILGTAIAGQADMLVSGDKKHLLSLGMVNEIPILSPRKAIEKILSTSSA